MIGSKKEARKKEKRFTRQEHDTRTQMYAFNNIHAMTVICERSIIRNILRL